MAMLRAGPQETSIESRTLFRGDALVPGRPRPSRRHAGRRRRPPSRHHGCAAAVRDDGDAARVARLRGRGGRAVRAPVRGRAGGERRRDPHGLGRRSRRRRRARRPVGGRRSARRRRRRHQRRRPRLLHGRPLRAQGRGDRSLRSGGGVLRDDPPARRVEGPGQAVPLDTAADVCPTLAIFGSVDDDTAADIEALRARGPVATTARSSSSKAPITASCTIPIVPAHRADDAGRALARAIAWLSLDGRARSRCTGARVSGLRLGSPLLTPQPTRASGGSSRYTRVRASSSSRSRIR